MKNKVYITILILTLLAALPRPVCADHETEYHVKAAFIYNFMKFVEWPKDKLSDDDKTIVIGVIGENPFGNAFDAVKSKTIKDRKLTFRWFKSYEKLRNNTRRKTGSQDKLQDLAKCHLLFICSSEAKYIKQIVESVKPHYVLTVADMESFVDSGGIVNLLIEDNKVRFEINTAIADRDGIKISAKLLRLAKRVVTQAGRDSKKDDTKSQKKAKS